MIEGLILQKPAQVLIAVCSEVGWCSVLSTALEPSMAKAIPEPHCSNTLCREMHEDPPGCKERATLNGTGEQEILHIALSPLHVHAHKE